MPAPNPLLTGQANTIAQSVETSVINLSLDSQQAKYPLIFNVLRVSSNTGCVDFLANIYKNGSLIFSQRTGTTTQPAFSTAEWKIDLVCEPGGTVLVTITNELVANHSFFAELMGI